MEIILFQNSKGRGHGAVATGKLVSKPMNCSEDTALTSLNQATTYSHPPP